MKTQLLIGVALFAVTNVIAQTSRPASRTRIDVRTIATYKYKSEEGIPSEKKAVSLPAKLKSSSSLSTGNWNNFTSSMNIYGASNSYVKPLQWNDELNAVTFMHRKSPYYISNPVASPQAENGTIVAMISTDCGQHWDSTALWVNNSFWARYPSGSIYNPASNTSIGNAYIVGAGPTTGASTGWIGNWYASKQLGTSNYNNTPSTATNAQQIAVTAGPFLPNVGRHDFAAYGFTATDDGKMRILAGITDDGLVPTSDTAIMMVTGNFNNGVFDWTGRTFSPLPVTKKSTDGSFNFISRPMMAWNEAGTIGYVVVMGSRLGASGANVGFQPIVYKTIDAGANWLLETTAIDFNSNLNQDVLRSLPATEEDTSLAIPNFYFGEGMDCAVDANNKLHIFTTILGHTSTNLDLLDFVFQMTSQKYLWKHMGGQRPYLYDFVYDGTALVPSWSHILVDSMSSEGVTQTQGNPGYDDNPWDVDPTESNQKLRIDARLQMSRTPDGKYLLYTWAESDTSLTDGQRQWNSIPNVKARLIDVMHGTLSNTEIDITNSDIITDGRATCHFISPKFKLNNTTSSDIDLDLPVTVSNSLPYAQRTTNFHWYSCANLIFSKSGAIVDSAFVDKTGIKENVLTAASGSYLYPNPAKNSVNVKLNLQKTIKVQLQLMDAVGQVIRSTELQGQAGANTMNVDLSALSPGIYFVNIKTGNTQSTKKLVIE